MGTKLKLNIAKILIPYKLDDVSPGFDRVPVNPDVGEILDGLDVIVILQLHGYSRMMEERDWPEFGNHFGDLASLVIKRIHLFYLS